MNITQNVNIYVHTLFHSFSRTELGSMELPESSGTGTELAKCESGYAMPSPDVAWLKYDGTVVQTCDISNVDELNTQERAPNVS